VTLELMDPSGSRRGGLVERVEDGKESLHEMVDGIGDGRDSSESGLGNERNQRREVVRVFMEAPVGISSLEKA
jgi:hypothetical protein